MNTMTELVQANALEWLIVVTSLLMIGFAIQSIVRNQLLKQRVGELTVACILFWGVLAVIPMPRNEWALFGNDPPADVQSDLKNESTTAKSQTTVEPIRIADPGKAEQSAPAKDGPEVSPKLAINLARKNELKHSLTASSSSFDLSKTSHDDVVTAALPTPWMPKPLVVAWLVGACAMVVWILGGHLVLLAVRLRSRPPCNRVLRIYSQLQSEGGPSIGVSRGQKTFITGILRPKIVLPESIVSQSSKEQISCLLTHELAHWRQRDAWGRAIFNIALPLLYFHPLYWLTRYQSDLSAELVADQIATQAIDRTTYAQSLVDVSRNFPDRIGIWSIPIYRGASSFFGKRIKLLLQPRQIAISVSGYMQLAIVTATIAISIFTAMICGTSQEDVDQSQLDRLRNSLHQQSTLEFADRAAARVPADAWAFVSLDLAEIRGKWSFRQQALLNPSGGHFGAVSKLIHQEKYRLLDRFCLRKSELFDIATGQVTLAVCPTQKGFASIAVIDSENRNAEIDRWINRISATIPGGELRVESIEGRRYYKVTNRDSREHTLGNDRLICVLPLNDELLISDDEDILKSIVSPAISLLASQDFREAKQKAIDDLSVEGTAHAFAFVRPFPYCRQFLSFDENGLQARNLMSTILGSDVGVAAEWFSVAIATDGGDLKGQCYLKTPEHQSDNLLSFLAPIDISQLNSMAPAGLKGQVSLNIDGPQLLKNIAPVLDELAGKPGSFNRAKKNLKEDPAGPRFDLNEFCSRLDGRFTLHWHSLGNASPLEWLAEVPIRKAVADTRRDLSRLFEGGFKKQKHQELVYLQLDAPNLTRSVSLTDAQLNKQFGTSFGTEFEDETKAEELEAEVEIKSVPYPRRSLAISRDHLMVASSPEMLIAMSERADPTMTLSFTTDYSRILKELDIQASDPPHGFWFERTISGAMGATLRKQPDGWRLRLCLSGE